MSPRTPCVVPKQSWKPEGRFPSTLELPSWNRSHKKTVLVTKRVAVAPFELNIGPNESYGRAASVGTPPGAQKAQIRAKFIVKLPINRPGGRYVMSSPTWIPLTGFCFLCQRFPWRTSGCLVKPAQTWMPSTLMGLSLRHGERWDWQP